MSYKIAIASSDGEQIDETFGTAKSFLIYEVTDGKYRRLGEKVFNLQVAESVSLPNGCNPSGGCGSERGCGSQAGGGCGGQGEASAKVELISDCRCVVCRKIGFHIQKQLERKAISAFDVNCPVDEALKKISHYFNRIDNHESLRAQR